MSTRLFTVYYKPACPYSVKALRLLEEKFPDATINQIVVDSTNEFIFQKNARTALGITDCRRLTYPQIWDGTQYIGGCDDLEASLG